LVERLSVYSNTKKVTKNGNLPEAGHLTLPLSTALLADSDSPVSLSGCVLVKIDIFQQKMDFILEKCPETVSSADDIAVNGPTEKEHDSNLHNLMLVARQCGLVFNLDKCKIKESKITFFGMLFDAEGIHPDPEKIEAIKAIREPQDTQELQSFLGIATYRHGPFHTKSVGNVRAPVEPT
jgi:hypothetical protein